MKIQNNKFPKNTIAIALVISIIYFVIASLCAEDKVWDTATTFLITIISIVIGSMISIIIYNYQKKLESNQKLYELSRNLEAELSDINRLLNSGETLNVNGLNFLITFIEPIIIQECAKSGLYSSLDIENLLHIHFTKNKIL